MDLSKLAHDYPAALGACARGVGQPAHRWCAVAVAALSAAALSVLPPSPAHAHTPCAQAGAVERAKRAVCGAHLQKEASSLLWGPPANEGRAGERGEGALRV